MFRIFLIPVWIPLFSLTALAGYVKDREAAMELYNQGKYDRALSTFIEMAERAKYDKQKTDALEQAPMCAIRLKTINRSKKSQIRSPQTAYAVMS